MAIEPQNLIQIQSDLQNPALVTNDTLLKYANGANPQVPSFLALLEMYKQGYIEIDQIDRFGDITVQWTGIGPGHSGPLEIDTYEG